MIQSFEGVLAKFDSELWYYHVMVPPAIQKFYKSKAVNRLLATIADSVQIHCAIMPAGEGDYFININKEVRKKLEWKVGQKRLITLEPDNSKYGMHVAMEFEEVLASDSEGSNFFHQLSMGKQRNLIYLASKPKTSATRLKKSIIIIDYLKEANGELDFKALNQAFKDRKNDF